MNISLHFLWILVLGGGSTATATDDSGSCKATKELDALCGTHTFQSVNPILNYVDQLQREQLSYAEEKKEINELREKVQQLKQIKAEGIIKDDLILNMKTHVRDLQATVYELRYTNHVLRQNEESVNSEIAQLKTFIREEFDKQLSKVNSSASKLRYCDDQIEKNDKTVAQYAKQLESRNKSLQGCELSLNETQNVVQESKDQLENQNKTIARNTATISRLEEDIETKKQTLNDAHTKLKVNQDESKKLTEIIEQMKVEVVQLKEKLKVMEELPASCTFFGDSNVHKIKVPNFKAFPVLCNSEIAGPGWTVIQQRIKGGEDFNRDWETYKNGFGDFTGDFFLGLEKIHRLTNSTPHELYIHMEGFRGGIYRSLNFNARYDNFSIAGEDDKYRLLSLGTYSGDAGEDKMRYIENQQFSTFDSDNDALNGRNCAEQYQGGWWYRECTDCHLNGKYYQQEVVYSDSNWWFAWYSLKTIKMLIRPRGN